MKQNTVLIHTLSNGIQAVFVPRQGTKICKISALVDAGSLCDDTGGYPSGTAHFVEHMVFNGTEKYKTREELLNIVINDGGLRNGTTGYFWQQYFISTLNQFTESALDYLSQAVLYPAFSEKDFEKEKKVILAEWAKDNSNPERRFYIQGINATIFENPAMQHTALGSKSGVESIQFSDIQRFHAEFFVPENITLFVIGDYTESDIVEKLEQYFGKKKAGKVYAKPKHTIVTSETHDTVMYFSGLTDTKLAYANFIPDISEPEYIAISLVARILAGGPTSRLMRELREKRGMIYGISTNALLTEKGLAFSIVTQSDQKNITEIQQVILGEIQNISDEGVIQSELDQIRNRYLQFVERENDSTESLLSEYIEYYKKYQKIYNREYIESMIQSVTLQDIQNAAKKVLKYPARWTEMRPE
jgi:predicted Zn-dependent peptidase